MSTRVSSKAKPAARTAKVIRPVRVAKPVAPVAKQAAKAVVVAPRFAPKSAVPVTAKQAKAAAPAVVDRPGSNGTNGKHVFAIPNARLNGSVDKPSSPTAAAAATGVGPSRPSAGGKSKRNLAGLGVKELAHFRTLLLEKRHDILGDMHSMEKEALRVDGTTLTTLPVHVADMGTDNYEQEFTLGLVEKERTLLREIYAALAKMQTGTYGICEGTGAPISKARLEVQPWARYSIEFARLREKSAMGTR